MPKIIPELGPKILQAAARHFETKGYQGTDMKSLATELGISVGTLYNYYASKPELFLDVSLLWKAVLGERLLHLLDNDDAPAVKLRRTLFLMYEDMVAYTGRWREFTQSGAKFDRDSAIGRRFREDNEELYRRIQELLQLVWKDRPHTDEMLDDPVHRLAQVIVGSIMQLVMNPGNDPGANSDFVKHWIDFVAPLPSGSGSPNR